MSDLKGINYQILPDRIETGTFLAAIAMTRGKAKLKKTNPDNLDAVLSKFKDSLFRLGPLILLIYVCISEFHTQFYYWGIFSFNLQFIVIYYWILRDPDILGYGFVLKDVSLIIFLLLSLRLALHFYFQILHVQRLH